MYFTILGSLNPLCLLAATSLANMKKGPPLLLAEDNNTQQHSIRALPHTDTGRGESRHRVRSSAGTRLLYSRHRVRSSIGTRLLYSYVVNKLEWLYIDYHNGYDDCHWMRFWRNDNSRFLWPIPRLGCTLLLQVLWFLSRYRRVGHFTLCGIEALPHHIALLAWIY